MKIKVCGMKNPENIEQLGLLPIDFMGLIFYPKSPRYATNLDLSNLSTLPDSVERVGVFVNEELQTIISLVDKYKLTYIQLHGTEIPEFCKQCCLTGTKVIKAFNISNESDLEIAKDYADSCDYFLFDTKTPQHGGSGLKFDWNILNVYHGTTPFFLSGGISESDIISIQNLSYPQLYALDLNSRFEIEPGMKDINKLKNFISHFKTISL